MSSDAPTDRGIATALPAGTRFGELEILGTLAEGGFGIIYLAQDHALERQVAIKEYMPAMLAQRNSRAEVSMRSGAERETFEAGRRSFVNEARLLARFDHASLIKVYRFWEANGTAYMLMPRLVGQTLRRARFAMERAPDEAWLKRMLDALLDALALLHTESIWHRDIAPDNIFLPDGGAPPILLDFGAARQAISDRAEGLTAILKPSYAPIEQYAETAQLRQGPWTDLYALGVVLHELITGHTPPAAPVRSVDDDYQSLAERGLPGYSPGFLTCIDWMLRLHPHDRPQSVAHLRAALQGRIEPAAPQWLPSAPAPLDETPPAGFEDTRLQSVGGFAETRLLEEDGFAPTRVLVGGESTFGAATPVPVATPASSKSERSGSRSARKVRKSGASSRVAATAGRARWPYVLAAGLGGAILLGALVQTLLKPPAAPVALQAQATSDAAVQASSVPSAPLVSETASVDARDSLDAELPLTALRPASAPMPSPSVKPAKKRVDTAPAVGPEAPPPAPAKPVATTASVPSSAPAPVVTPALSEHASPQDACASSSFLARPFCMERECEKPQWQSHAQCRRLRELRENRERNRNGGSGVS